MGKRTRAINRKLTDVKALTIPESKEVFPEIASGEIIDAEDLENEQS